MQVLGFIFSGLLFSCHQPPSRAGLKISFKGSSLFAAGQVTIGKIEFQNGRKRKVRCQEKR